MFVVTAKFRIRPGSAEAFMEAMAEQARNSLLEERSCAEFGSICR